jgi:hypothetical protein
MGGAGHTLAPVAIFQAAIDWLKGENAWRY